MPFGPSSETVRPLRSLGVLMSAFETRAYGEAGVSTLQHHRGSALVDRADRIGAAGDPADVERVDRDLLLHRRVRRHDNDVDVEAVLGVDAFLDRNVAGPVRGRAGPDHAEHDFVGGVGRSGG